MMKISIFLIFVSITINAANTSIQGRIISGKNAILGQFPWQVLIKRADRIECGGSILSEEWVLTAAHCTHQRVSLNLVFGVINVNENGITMKVTNNDWIIHPKYSETNLNYDISLIKLPQKLNFNGLIQPITLNKSRNSFVGQLCVISGWGTMSDKILDPSNDLLYAKVNIIENSECKKFYDTDGFITDKIICTVGSNNSYESICGGDSGGPLVMFIGNKAIQIGINLFSAEDGCAEKLPAGYLRVNSFIRYIRNQIGLSMIWSV